MTEDESARFGAWLRAKRKQRGWTQAQVADLVQISRSAVSMLENAKMLIGTDTAIDMGRAMGGGEIEIAIVIGILQNVTEADAQLVELIRRLPGEDRALLEEFARVMLRRAEASSRH